MKKDKKFTQQEIYKLRQAAKALEQSAEAIEQAQRHTNRGIGILEGFQQNISPLSAILQQQ